jgi:hypothetical protein
MQSQTPKRPTEESKEADTLSLSGETHSKTTSGQAKATPPDSQPFIVSEVTEFGIVELE